MNGEQYRRIAFIGFGEVGSIFAQDLVAVGKDVVVYDQLFLKRKASRSILEKAKSVNVCTTTNLKEAVGSADLIFSTVTASSALPVAKEVSLLLGPRQLFVDLNSVSPETKKRIDKEIRKLNADFVEGAVMAAVKLTRLRTPILFGGPRALELTASLNALGMDTSAASDKIGVASAIKMCRSVVMKGLAALVIESLFAARRYGAEDAVIASFEQTYPGMGWSKGFPDSLTRRAVEHSRRREAEMREVVETLKSAGMSHGMSSSTADLQNWLTTQMESRRLEYKEDRAFNWREIADAIADQ